MTCLNNLCLEGNTFIILSNNVVKPIKELVGMEYFYVYSVDLTNKKIDLSLVDRVCEVGVNKCVKITLNNNKSIMVTYNHELIDYDGNTIKASDLVIGQTFMPYHSNMCLGETERVWKKYVLENYRSVIDIEYLEDVMPVYSISVSRVHTCALSVGIFVTA